METAYLDFQIFDKSSKNPEILEALQSANYVYYCSAGHAEEIWRAQSHAGKGSENQGAANRIEDCIEKLCAPGVLNPSFSGVELRNEPFDTCLQRVKTNPTEDVILKNAQKLKELNNQHPDFSSQYYSSEEKWKIIWEEPTTKKYLEDMNAEPVNEAQLNELFHNLCAAYGQTIAAEHTDRQREAFMQKLEYGSYPNIKDSFSRLETFIEKLSRILTKTGYARGKKNIRIINSGEYDISHLVYGTHCNCFISEDQCLVDRAKAIYHYLDIPTRVIIWSDFKNEIGLQEDD